MIPDGVKYNGMAGDANSPCHGCPRDGNGRNHKSSCYSNHHCDLWKRWFVKSWEGFNRYAKKQAEIQNRMQSGTGT